MKLIMAPIPHRSTSYQAGFRFGVSLFYLQDYYPLLYHPNTHLRDSSPTIYLAQGCGSSA